MTIPLRQPWEVLVPWKRTPWHWSKQVKFRPTWLFHKGCLYLHSCQTAMLPHVGPLNSAYSVFSTLHSFNILDKAPGARPCAHECLLGRSVADIMCIAVYLQFVLRSPLRPLAQPCIFEKSPFTIALGLALGESWGVACPSTEKHWCPVCTFAYFRGKAFLGKLATFTFVGSKDVNS